MRRKFKIISILTCICFIANCLWTDLAFSSPHYKSGVSTLAPCSIFDELKGIEYKDIGRIKLALQANLLSLAKNRNNIEIAEIKEETVYRPAIMHFFLHEMEALPNGNLQVRCRIGDEDTRGRSDSVITRDYIIVFSPCADDNGGFPMEVYTLREWSRLESFVTRSGIFPERRLDEREPVRKDAESVDRYIQHEIMIDRWIAEHMKDPESSLTFRDLNDFVSGETFRLIWHDFDDILGGVLSGVLNNRDIVLIKTGNDERFPVIDESGKKVVVHSHASENAIYLFVDEKVFKHYMDNAGSRDTEDYFAFKSIVTSLVHEIGVICGLDWDVEKGPGGNIIVNDLDRFFGSYMSGGISNTGSGERAGELRSRLKPFSEFGRYIKTRDYAGGYTGNGRGKEGPPDVIVEDDDENAAKRVAREIVDQVKEKPDSVLGLATGGSPLEVYAWVIRLTEEEDVDWSRVKTFNLDEYVGIAPGHPERYRNFMDRNLFNGLVRFGLKPENTHIPPSSASDPHKAIEDYVSSIHEAGGVDLWLLGVGRDGHYAFLEPALTIDREYQDFFREGRFRPSGLSGPVVSNIRDYNEFVISPDNIVNGYDGAVRVISDILEMQKRIRNELQEFPDLLKRRMDMARVFGQPVNEDEAKRQLERLGRRMQEESGTVFYVDMDERAMSSLRAVVAPMNGNVEILHISDYFGNSGKVVNIALPTIIDNSRFFRDVNEVPLKALTCTGVVRESKRLIQIVTGSGKATALEGALRRPVSPAIPSAILREHPDYTIVADKEAASRLVYDRAYGGDHVNTMRTIEIEEFVSRLREYVSTSSQQKALSGTLESAALVRSIGERAGLSTYQLLMLDAAVLAADITKLFPDRSIAARHEELIRIVEFRDKERGIEKIKANEIVAAAKGVLGDSLTADSLLAECCNVWVREVNAKLLKMRELDLLEDDVGEVDPAVDRAVIEPIAAHELAAVRMLAGKFPELPSEVKALVATHHDGGGLDFFAREYGVDTGKTDLHYLMSVFRAAHAFHAAEIYDEKPEDTLDFVINRMLPEEGIDKRGIIATADHFGLKEKAEEGISGLSEKTAWDNMRKSVDAGEAVRVSGEDLPVSVGTGQPVDWSSMRENVPRTIADVRTIFRMYASIAGNVNTENLIEAYEGEYLRESQRVWIRSRFAGLTGMAFDEYLVEAPVYSDPAVDMVIFQLLPEHVREWITSKYCEVSGGSGEEMFTTGYAVTSSLIETVIGSIKKADTIDIYIMKGRAGVSEITGTKVYYTPGNDIHDKPGVWLGEGFLAEETDHPGRIAEAVLLELLSKSVVPDGEEPYSGPVSGGKIHAQDDNVHDPGQLVTPAVAGLRNTTGTFIPFYQFRSRDDWGIGDFESMKRSVDLHKALGQNVMQFSPFPISSANNSPYSVASSRSIDPVYINVEAMFREFNVPEGVVREFMTENEELLGKLKASDKVDYDAVRKLKYDAFRIVWASFSRETGTGLHRLFKEFRINNSDWLEDHMLYLVLKDQYLKEELDSGVHWTRLRMWDWRRWKEGLRDRDPAAIKLAKKKYEEEILFRSFLQFVADNQYTSLSEYGRANGVEFMIDMPFALDGADIWCNPKIFGLHRKNGYKRVVTQGVPPEPAYPAGQYWQFYPYDWSNPDTRRFVLGIFGYYQSRASYVRLDHVLGFYRQYLFTEDTDSKMTLQALDIYDDILKIQKQAIAGTEEDKLEAAIKIWRLIRYRLTSMRGAVPGDLKYSLRSDTLRLAFGDDGCLTPESMVMVARSVPEREYGRDLPEGSPWKREYVVEKAVHAGKQKWDFINIATGEGGREAVNIFQYLFPEGSVIPDGENLVRPDDSIRLASFKLCPGESIMSDFLRQAQERGTTMIWETLGIVPDRIQASVERLGGTNYVPVIWGDEKLWGSARNPYHPSHHIENAFVTYGLHDSVTMRTRVDHELEHDAKAGLLDEGLGPFNWDLEDMGVLTPRVRKMLLEKVASSRGKISVYTWIDLLGLGEEYRLNRPGTQERQWVSRLPSDCTIEHLLAAASGDTHNASPMALEAVDLLRHLTVFGKRTRPGTDPEEKKILHVAPEVGGKVMQIRGKNNITPFMVDAYVQGDIEHVTMVIEDTDGRMTRVKMYKQKIDTASYKHGLPENVSKWSVRWFPYKTGLFRFHIEADGAGKISKRGVLAAVDPRADLNPLSPGYDLKDRPYFMGISMDPSRIHAVIYRFSRKDGIIPVAERTVSWQKILGMEKDADIRGVPPDVAVSGLADVINNMMRSAGVDLEDLNNLGCSFAGFVDEPAGTVSSGTRGDHIEFNRYPLGERLSQLIGVNNIEVRQQARSTVRSEAAMGVFSGSDVLEAGKTNNGYFIYCGEHLDGGMLKDGKYCASDTGLAVPGNQIVAVPIPGERYRYHYRVMPDNMGSRPFEIMDMPDPDDPRQITPAGGLDLMKEGVNGDDFIYRNDGELPLEEVISVLSIENMLKDKGRLVEQFGGSNSDYAGINTVTDLADSFKELNVFAGYIVEYIAEETGKAVAAVIDASYGTPWQFEKIAVDFELYKMLGYHTERPSFLTFVKKAVNRELEQHFRLPPAYVDIISKKIEAVDTDRGSRETAGFYRGVDSTFRVRVMEADKTDKEALEMRETALEVGVKIAPPVNNYTIFAAYDLFKDDEEYEKDKGEYGSRFGLERITTDKAGSIVGNVLSVIDQKGLEYCNVIVQLPSEFKEARYGQDLEKLASLGIKFMIIETFGLKKEKETARVKYRRNIYSMLLLARTVDEHTREDSRVFRLLEYLLNSYFQDGKDKKERVKAYMAALMTYEIDAIVNNILFYKPIDRFDAREDHENITEALMSA